MADKVKTFRNTPDSELEEGMVFKALTTYGGFTQGKEYTLEPATCGCCTWAFTNDRGWSQSLKGLMPDFEPVDTKPEMVFPTSEFRFFNDSQKGAILLAKSKGERIQILVDYSNWVEHTGAIHPDGIYRLTPRKVIEDENRRAELVASINKTETSLRLA